MSKKINYEISEKYTLSSYEKSGWVKNSNKNPLWKRYRRYRFLLDIFYEGDQLMQVWLNYNIVVGKDKNIRCCEFISLSKSGYVNRVYNEL